MKAVYKLQCEGVYPGAGVVYPEGEDGDGETAGLAFAEGASHSGRRASFGRIYSSTWNMCRSTRVVVGAGARGGVEQREAGARGLPTKATAGHRPGSEAGPEQQGPVEEPDRV